MRVAARVNRLERAIWGGPCRDCVNPRLCFVVGDDNPRPEGAGRCRTCGRTWTVKFIVLSDRERVAGGPERSPKRRRAKVRP